MLGDDGTEDKRFTPVLGEFELVRSTGVVGGDDGDDYTATCAHVYRAASTAIR